MHPHSVQDQLAEPARFFPEEFAFVVCQWGAEAPIKQHLKRESSPFHLAFSRPGLVTFKSRPVSGSLEPEPSVSLQSGLPEHPLIRQTGWVMGQVRGTQAEEMVENVRTMAGDHWDSVHVFGRDLAHPGDGGFEPGRSPLADEIGNLFRRCGTDENSREFILNQTATAGQRVLDVILVEPNHWIVGYHQVLNSRLETSWPGGVFSVNPPANAISRAYLKVSEAIAWSQLPIQVGDSIVEIGSAPGGAAQRLLDMGLEVTGVDPAEMDPLLLNHPRFCHWRAKSMAIKRKRYSKFRWLTADANVAPNYTLDCVEDIVTYPTSRLEGLLLTLKLTDYKLLANIDDYFHRIQSWGFTRVRAQQLAFNRREICVVAAR